MFRYGFGVSVVAAATVIGSHYVIDWPQPAQEKATIQTAPPKKKSRTTTTVVNTVPAASSGTTSSRPAEESFPPDPTPAPPAPPAPPVPRVAPVQATPVTPVTPVTPLIPPAPEAPSTEPEAPGKPLIGATSGVTCTAVDTVFEGIKALEVKGTFCNITLQGRSDSRLTFKGHVSPDGANRVTCGETGWKDKDLVIRYEREKDVLRVMIEMVKLDDKVKIENAGKDPTTLDFGIPERVALRISNNSGNITASSLVSDSVRLSTNFGNVKAEGGKGNFNFSTSSGNIGVNGLNGRIHSSSKFGHQKYEHTSGDLDIGTSSGNVKVEEHNGRVEASTSFGHQQYENVTGPMKVSSQSGNISIEDSRGACDVSTSFGHQEYTRVKGDIRAVAASGNIRLEDVNGKMNLQTSFGHINGDDVNLSGDSEFRSSSGHITMELKNPLKELRFDLSSANGRISVEKDNTSNNSDRSLQVGDGKILVKGVSSFGGQKYR